MNQASDILRRSFAAFLATLVLAVGAVQPVLAEADLSHPITVETQHDPGDCPQGHDHTVCTQLGANYATPTAMAVRGSGQPVVQAIHGDVLVTVVLSVHREGHPSRAPPSA